VQTAAIVFPQLLGGRGQQFPMLTQGPPGPDGPGTATMVETRVPEPEVERPVPQPTGEAKPTFRRKINVIGLSPTEIAGTPPESTTEPASAAPPEAPVESQPPSGQLNLTEWEPFLDGDPGDFVRALLERAQFGEPPTVLAVQLILSFPDAQSLLAALAPHKDGAPPEVQDVITRLEAKPDWVDEAMRLLRERQT